MGALDRAVRVGKALYVGVSSCSAEKTKEAYAILRDFGTPLLTHQPSYSMLNRWIEDGLLELLGELGVGCTVFSPLAQGCSRTSTCRGSPPTRVLRRTLPVPESPQRRGARSHPRPERDRGTARAVARAAGARVDASRPARHLGADWSE
jgi:aryl-alcohol dehydrogenase-like predicted oxidoreductase